MSPEETGGVPNGASVDRGVPPEICGEAAAAPNFSYYGIDPFVK